MRQRGSWRRTAVGPVEGASLLGGVGVGLALMYFLDPAQGGRRLRREPPPDEVVLARVRAAVQRLALHPTLITSHVNGGRVTLEGTVLAGERRRLVRAVKKARGVRRVADSLVEQSVTADGADAPAAAGLLELGTPNRRWLARAACFTAGAACGAVAVVALQGE